MLCSKLAKLVALMRTPHLSCKESVKPVGDGCCDKNHRGCDVGVTKPFRVPDPHEDWDQYEPCEGEDVRNGEQWLCRGLALSCFPRLVPVTLASAVYRSIQPLLQCTNTCKNMQSPVLNEYASADLKPLTKGPVALGSRSVSSKCSSCFSQ